MPVFTPEYLHKVAYHIYRAKGTPEDEAEIVANHLVKANLVGHDSHGIIQTPTYVDRIDAGHIVPGAAFDIVKEAPCTAVIDGNWGFGFVQTEKATRLAIEKAKTNGVGAVTVYHQSHIGRLGDYPTMMAAEDMIGLITADSGAAPKHVAPFGGVARKLGTNPISIGMPSNLDGPVLMDMASSTVALGKIALSRNRKEDIPLGWIVDKNGNPTTNPNDYYSGGAILPVGVDQGHKGYALSFMVEVFSGLLTGLGFGIDPEGRHNDGVFIAAFNLSHFRDVAEFKSDMDGFVEFIKDSPPAKGFTEVLYPGEIEYNREQARRKDGIFVEDETWAQLSNLMKSLNVEGEVGQP